MFINNTCHFFFSSLFYRFTVIHDLLCLLTTFILILSFIHWLSPPLTNSILFFTIKKSAFFFYFFHVSYSFTGNSFIKDK